MGDETSDAGDDIERGYRWEGVRGCHMCRVDDADGYGEESRRSPWFVPSPRPLSASLAFFRYGAGRTRSERVPIDGFPRPHDRCRLRRHARRPTSRPDERLLRPPRARRRSLWFVLRLETQGTTVLTTCSGPLSLASLIHLTGAIKSLTSVLLNPNAEPGERLAILREVAEYAQRFKLGGEDKIRVVGGVCEGVSPSPRAFPL
jgi:hypothetical protein